MAQALVVGESTVKMHLIHLYGKLEAHSRAQAVARARAPTDRLTDSDDPPRRYRIRIRDHLDPFWSDWLDGFDIDQHEDGTTTLTGQLVDQAELFGLLNRLRNLGATLLTVEQTDRKA